MFPLNSWRVIWFCWPAKHPHPTCSHSHSPHSHCNYLKRKFPGVPRHHFLLIGCLHHQQLLKSLVSCMHHVAMVNNMWPKPVIPCPPNLAATFFTRCPADVPEAISSRLNSVYILRQKTGDGALSSMGSSSPWVLGKSCIFLCFSRTGRAYFKIVFAIAKAYLYWVVIL